MTKRVKLITTEEVFKRLNHLINEPFGNLLNSEIRNLKDCWNKIIVENIRRDSEQ